MSSDIRANSDSRIRQKKTQELVCLAQVPMLDLVWMSSPAIRGFYRYNLRARVWALNCMDSSPSSLMSCSVVWIGSFRHKWLSIDLIGPPQLFAIPPAAIDWLWSETLRKLRIRWWRWERNLIPNHYALTLPYSLETSQTSSATVTGL